MKTVPVIIYLNEAVYDEVDSICKTVGTDLRDLIEKKTNADLLHLRKDLRGVTRPKTRRKP